MPHDNQLCLSRGANSADRSISQQICFKQVHFGDVSKNTVGEIAVTAYSDKDLFENPNKSMTIGRLGDLLKNGDGPVIRGIFAHYGQDIDQLLTTRNTNEETLLRNVRDLSNGRFGVPARAAEYLGEYGGKSALAALTRVGVGIHDPDSEVRDIAQESLAKIRRWLSSSASR